MNNESTTIEDLYKKADEKLYVSKQNGRNTIVFYDFLRLKILFLVILLAITTKIDKMEWIVTLILVSIAGLLFFSGSKMSATQDKKNSEAVKDKWDEIKKKRYEKK